MALWAGHREVMTRYRDYIGGFEVGLWGEKRGIKYRMEVETGNKF